MWVHGFQHDLEPDVWAGFFAAGLRARLEPVTAPAAHPYHGSSAGLLERVQTLPADAQTALYRGSIYGWINWFGRRETDAAGEPTWRVSGCGGLHATLGLTEAEALMLIGAPSLTEVAAWKLSQHTPIDYAVFERLALLFGIGGTLILRFGDDAVAIAAWLTTTRIGEHLARAWLFTGVGGLSTVREALLTADAH
jgi:hypothetical protein